MQKLNNNNNNSNNTVQNSFDIQNNIIFRINSIDIFSKNIINNNSINDRLLIHSFSLCIENNMKVLISGSSGCGKSTLLSFISSLNNETVGIVLAPQIPFCFYVYICSKYIRAFVKSIIYI